MRKDDYSQEHAKNKSKALSVAEAAKEYLALGLKVHPVSPRSKKPSVEDWPNYEADPDNVTYVFPDGINIGVQNGARSNNVCDVDNDWEETIFLADALIANYPTFGRSGKPRSHHLVKIADSRSYGIRP
jgi:hypothetical protein